MIALILPLAMLLLAPPAPGQPAAVDSRSVPVLTQMPKMMALPPEVELPTYRPGPMPFRDGEKLTYVASWLGIPAAEAQIELHRAPQNPAVWIAEATIRTNKAVDVVYKMRDYIQERFAAGTFQPREMQIRQRENHRHDDYAVTFDHAQNLVTMRKSGPRGIQLKRFTAANPWGIISGAALTLSQPLKVDDRFVLDLFSATNRYVLSFTVVGRDRIQTALGVVEALRIEPAVVYLSDSKMRGEASATTIWVSDDARRLPLRVESATFIGTVRVDLTKVENAHADAAGESDGRAR
ncbi:MAG TPA: DUF3108 domain-containing protein [Candidatus Binataceae bacterium]|nr:DUF3108 domain-containing protein [Candidatus Binataceae bacterium]